MLPSMSFLTGVNAIEPKRSGKEVSIFAIIAPEPEVAGNLPKRVVNDSAASRKSEVGMALPLEESTGTSTKDFLRVSNQVPPGGIAAWNAIVSSNGCCGRSECDQLVEDPLEVGISKRETLQRDSSDLISSAPAGAVVTLPLMSLARGFNILLDGLFSNLLCLQVAASLITACIVINLSK